MVGENNYINAKAIVIDNGSFLSKCGIAGENRPRFVFPTVIGHPRDEFAKFLEADVSRDYFVGNEAIDNMEILKPLKSPSYKGDIEEWDDMEKLWHYTFDEALHVDPANHPVLIYDILAPIREQSYNRSSFHNN